VGIFEALKCWITWLAKSIYYYMVEGVELVIDALAAAANVILGILPSVALPEPELDSGVVGMINFFVPIEVFLSVALAIMVAWVLYRIYVWGLRWAKAEE